MKPSTPLPNLFVPGAGKSGTSSLHHYLNQHPKIEMSKIKEPHFFCRDDYDRHWDQYLDLFDQHKNVPFRGESSTGYMAFPDAVKRITQHIKKPKFIFILRNPIDRAYSHYHWLKSEGFETNAFRQAILTDKIQAPVFNNRSGIGYKYYFQWGCYGKWLANYLQAIDFNQIHLMTTESFAQKPEAVMNRCFQFLGLSDHPIQFSRKFNPTRLPNHRNLYYKLRYYSISNLPGLGLLYYRLLPPPVRAILQKTRHGLAARYKQLDGHPYPPMTASDRTWLRELYKKDVNALKQLAGKSFREWHDFN